MLTVLIALNLLAAALCLGLAYGCWQLQQRLLGLQSQLVVWERRLSVGLPTTRLALTQGRYGIVQAQQQYTLWRRRRLQLLQLLQLLRQLQWAWRRF